MPDESIEGRSVSRIAAVVPFVLGMILFLAGLVLKTQENKVLGLGLEIVGLVSWSGGMILFMRYKRRRSAQATVIVPFYIALKRDT
ncbi:MAG: hypothetical protein ABSC93_24005 [Bryobacteraceae bacterium]|jgi:hypothetical protein